MSSPAFTTMETTGPRPLGDTYSKNGYQYKLIVRDGKVAIFGQIRKREPFDYVAYEVIVIEVKPPVTIMGKDYPEREVSPGNEEWGIHGFTYTNLSDAKVKMRALAKTIPHVNPSSGDDKRRKVSVSEEDED